MLRRISKPFSSLKTASVSYSKVHFNQTEQTEEEKWIAQKDHDLLMKKIQEASKKHAAEHAKEQHHEIKKEVTINKKDTDAKIDALLGTIKQLQTEIENMKKK